MTWAEVLENAIAIAVPMVGVVVWLAKMGQRVTALENQLKECRKERDHMVAEGHITQKDINEKFGTIQGQLGRIEGILEVIKKNGGIR